MYGEEDGRTALLATHIDPGWGGSNAYRRAVDLFIEEGEYDDLVCVSRQQERFSQGDYDDRADVVIPSDGGNLYDAVVAELLDGYDTFTHIGALWGLCHLGTFEDLVRGMQDRRGEEYRIDIPLDAVSTGRSTVYQEVKTELVRAGKEGESWFDHVRAWFRSDLSDVSDEQVEEALYGVVSQDRYGGYVDAVAGFGPAEVGVELVRDTALGLSYTFSPVRDSAGRVGWYRPSGFGEFS